MLAPCRNRFTSAPRCNRGRPRFGGLALRKFHLTGAPESATKDSTCKRSLLSPPCIGYLRLYDHAGTRERFRIPRAPLPPEINVGTSNCRLIIVLSSPPTENPRNFVRVGFRTSLFQHQGRIYPKTVGMTASVESILTVTSRQGRCAWVWNSVDGKAAGHGTSVRVGKKVIRHGAFAKIQINLIAVDPRHPYKPITVMLLEITSSIRAPISIQLENQRNKVIPLNIRNTLSSISSRSY